MPTKTKSFTLTVKEFDIVKILTDSKTSLTAAEIIKIDHNLSIHTVQAVLRNLLKRDLIEIDEVVYSGTVLSRSYKSSVTIDFFMHYFISRCESLHIPIDIPYIVSALLDQDANEKQSITALQHLLKARKQALSTK